MEFKLKKEFMWFEDALKYLSLYVCRVLRVHEDLNRNWLACVLKKIQRAYLVGFQENSAAAEVNKTGNVRIT
jgi:hypothetical protein